MKILLIDNYDSFTHMLADYTRQCDVACIVLRNDDKQLKDALFVGSFDGIILSPGPETPVKGGLMMEIISRHHAHMPMLGVCLGHQALGEFFGAKLQKASEPKHGKVDRVTLINKHKLFENVPDTFEVTRYHSLVLKEVIHPLTPLAFSAGKEIMALVHHELPLFGIQFHPESCLTRYGLTIIKNYTEIVKQHLT